MTEYYGHCPKCGVLLGFGHLPEKCTGTAPGTAPATSPESASCPSCGLPEKHFPYGAQYCPDKWHESPGGEPAMTCYINKCQKAHDVIYQICPECYGGLVRENADLRRQNQQLRDEAQGYLVAERAYISANAERLKFLARAETTEQENADLRRQVKSLTTELEDLNNAFCAEERLRISLEKSRRNEDVAPSDRRNNDACDDCATRWSQRLEGVETEYPCPQHKLTSAQQEKLK